jgi:fructose-specific phosphotransferase system IIC component
VVGGLSVASHRAVAVGMVLGGMAAVASGAPIGGAICQVVGVVVLMWSYNREEKR